MVLSARQPSENRDSEDQYTGPAVEVAKMLNALSNEEIARALSARLQTSDLLLKLAEERASRRFPHWAGVTIYTETKPLGEMEKLAVYPPHVG